MREALYTERAAAHTVAAELRRELEQQHKADKATAMTGASNGFTQQLQEQQDLSEQALARQAAQLQVGTQQSTC